MQMVGLAALAKGVKDWKLSGVEIGFDLIVAQKRRRDADNLMARVGKPVLDSLVNLGVLVDDSIEHVAVRFVTVTVDPVRAPRTIISIWQEAPE